MRGRTLASIAILLIASLAPLAMAKPHEGPGSRRVSLSSETVEAAGNATLVVTVNATGGEGTFAFEAEGEGLPATFTLATAEGTASATFSGLHAGNGSALEAAFVEGWRLLASSCSAGTPDAIELEENATTTCWFDMERLAALTVQVNASGNGTFAFAGAGAGLPAQFEITLENGTGNATFDGLVPGDNYSVEALDALGWIPLHQSCEGNFTLDAGGEATCWFEFGDQTQLRVEVVADGGDATFAFTGEGDGLPAWFNVTTTDGAGGVTFHVAPDEPLSAHILVPAGWELASGSCENVTVSTAASGTCTFTLERVAQVDVRVESIGGDATFTLQLSVNGSVTAHLVATDDGLAWHNFTGLDSDAAHAVSISVPSGWRLAGATCGEIDLSPGEAVLCVFTLTRLGEAQGRVTLASTGAGIAGVRVFADLDDDRVHDAGEPAATSASEGWYAVTGIPLGEVTLRVDLAGTGCTAVSPRSGARDIDVTAGSLHTGKHFSIACPGAPDDEEGEEDEGEEESPGRGRGIAGPGPGYWKNWRNHHTESQVTAWVQQAHDSASYDLPAGYAPTADGLRAVIIDSEGKCMKQLGKEECGKLRASVRELIVRLNELRG